LEYPWKIYSNSIGQQVKQIERINEQTVTLNRGDLPSGVYFIHLKQDYKVLSTFKIIIID